MGVIISIILLAKAWEIKGCLLCVVAEVEVEGLVKGERRVHTV